ncbi:hypothetical protein Acr_25g0000120 [Actinidia rufa]|uniref:Uncharacterized protein n=1 Tax=Actinidia rufa TaxID=165716 RepID=A0A7J0GXQ6_9ERIC|nr:hypothetical protein Acr_25g0000120 [Actinidia rufa]
MIADIRIRSPNKDIVCDALWVEWGGSCTWRAKAMVDWAHWGAVGDWTGVAGRGIGEDGEGAREVGKGGDGIFGAGGGMGIRRGWGGWRRSPELGEGVAGDGCDMR